MIWKGIVGRLFSPAEFESYVASLKFGAWRPGFIVVHNTSAPDLKTWHGWQARKPPIKDEQWAKNLVGYYRDQMHWSGGPHLFVTPAGILAFTPLTVPGTHSPAWNSISWGVETVGEFESEPFDGASRDNLVSSLATLHIAAGLSPLPYLLGHHGLHFHKEDPITTHKSCPGHHMVKADLVALVEAEIRRRNGGGHVPHAALIEAAEVDDGSDSAIGDNEQGSSVVVEPLAPAAVPHQASSVEIEVVKRRLDGFGYHEFGIMNGAWGGKTAAAIAAYKNDRHLRGEPVIDAALLADFDRAESESFHRPIADERANATEHDLRDRMPAVRQTLRQRMSAKVAALGSGIAAAFAGASDKFQTASEKLDPIKQMFGNVPGWVWFAVIAIAATGLWYLAESATQANVKDFNEGKRV